MAATSEKMVIARVQLSEIKRALTYPRLEWIQAPELHEFIGKYMEMGRTAGILKKVTGNADNHVLEAALLSSSDYLITGDHDMLSLKRIGRCKRVSAQEYLAIMT